MRLAVAAVALIALAALPGTAAALGRVQGKVVASDTGEPLGYADVLLLPADTTLRRVGGMTNADGTFLLEAAPGGYTLQVRLLAYAAMHDCGRPINPVIVEGQLHGGLAQGIGTALGEALLYDEAGQLLTGTLMDYPIPRADDLPTFAVAHMDFPSIVNPLGIKGVGESGVIAPAAAIANAVEDALADRGVLVDRVPLTPARVFDLLAGK